MTARAPAYTNDPRIAEIEGEEGGFDEGRRMAVLKPGYVVRGYNTHSFTFGNRAEFRSKLKLVEAEENGNV